MYSECASDNGSSIKATSLKNERKTEIVKYYFRIENFSKRNAHLTKGCAFVYDGCIMKFSLVTLKVSRPISLLSFKSPISKNTCAPSVSVKHWAAVRTNRFEMSAPLHVWKLYCKNYINTNISTLVEKSGWHAD